MLGNFPNCLAVTLEYEGLWSDHKADPGGATMKGVTLAVYRQHKPGATKADLRAIPNSEVEMIYRAGYWKPIKGDDLPAGVDLAVFDFGVNSGTSRAAKYLQRVVGVGADGSIGDVTLAAVRGADRKEVIQGLCGSRLSFVRALSTFKTFGKGWSRRIANVEAKAVAMAISAGAPLTEENRAELQIEAAVAETQASTESNKAGGTAASGGTIGGVDALASGGPNWLLIGVLASVVVCALVVFLLRAKQHKERAAAYQRVAAE